MGILLMIEFVAATWGGAWLAMRFRETTLWALVGWFAGAAIFAVLYSSSALDALNHFAAGATGYPHEPTSSEVWVRP